ncbi:ABC transporter ATP-binding protein [Anaerosacchariphilus polymeriproducens]|uniref:ABC transporter ATP-binding protein n=1 Tax=Anaerosacchariphilus polymeriproducens TaxID=1812858 RepID=A0A371AUW2_9FIRM|nr:ABC transporter ATP-binding protein [Anaerosacchariphilus polymeriproducens]RDU23357.1 ABC transporter ATP-binding protein [Anaerosacchariphilus polymeriproducens]
MNKIVSVKGLNKKINKKQILNNLSFEIEKGRIVGLLGPNGAGKTTLLKILMNIYHKDSGHVEICGLPLGYETKQHISYMPENNHLFPWMKINDAIQYYNDMFSDFDIKRADELCVILNINKEENISSLSKGGKERLLLMLTFARNTNLYLLDEPIGGIDPLTRKKLIKTIFSTANGECTILISTHQLYDVETLLDDVLFLHNGNLILLDSAEHIREECGKSLEEYYMEVFENA